MTDLDLDALEKRALAIRGCEPGSFAEQFKRDIPALVSEVRKLREALDLIASCDHGRDCPRRDECDETTDGNCLNHDKDCPACDCTIGIARAALSAYRNSHPAAGGT